MQNQGGGPKNKVELESQILCAALRQSWYINDAQGCVKAASELYKIFPDLLNPKVNLEERPVNSYQLLGLRPYISTTKVNVRFLQLARNYLRSAKKLLSGEYEQFLNASFILRKSRLRLSHDLVVIRNWLMANNVIATEGPFIVKGATPTSAAVDLSRTQPITTNLPRLVELLQIAQMIGPTEIQALFMQMAIDPEVTVEQLVLSSGYVTIAEIQSLKQADKLLEQGKITIAQFQVAMYDERTTGIKMIEALQVRGWLPNT